MHSDLSHGLIWSAREDDKQSDALWVTQANPERPLPFDKVTLSRTGSAGGARVTSCPGLPQAQLRANARQ